MGALAAGMGVRACVGGDARGFGGGVLGEGVVVEVDEVVVVVAALESVQEVLQEEVEGEGGEDAEEEGERIDVGDGSAGCWVLWARRMQSKVGKAYCCIVTTLSTHGVSMSRGFQNIIFGP